MTQREFWRVARRRHWQVNNGVRCDSGYCPLGAVVQEHLGFDHKEPVPRHVAEWLHLAPKFAQRIARAADSPRSKHRAWLVRQLGLRGETP